MEKTCPKCNSKFVGDSCPKCQTVVETRREVYIDPDFEEYYEQVMGESERFFRNLKWEDIPEDEVM